jgi:hypothetical protein
MKNIPLLIPQGDAEALRRQITQQVNRLKTQVAKSSQRTEVMDLGHNRITSVADPGAPTDAVNLRTLKKKIDEVTAQHVQRKQGNPNLLYTIVFSSIGQVVAGMLSAPYIIEAQKAGTPVNVKVAASSAPTSVPMLFNVAKNGVNILSSNGTLGTGVTSVIQVTNFNSNAKFSENDLITPVIAQSGSAGYVTIEIEVQP